MKAKGFIAAALLGVVSVPVQAMAEAMVFQAGEPERAGDHAYVQQERGLVAVPVGGRVGPFVAEGCPGVLAATVDWASRVAINARFTVSSASWGLPFVVTPQRPLANIDITFTNGTGAWTEFNSSALGGEHGVVPPGAVEAFVCLAQGIPTRFHYRAG